MPTELNADLPVVLSFAEVHDCMTTTTHISGDGLRDAVGAAGQPWMGPRARAAEPGAWAVVAGVLTAAQEQCVKGGLAWVDDQAAERQFWFLSFVDAK